MQEEALDKAEAALTKLWLLLEELSARKPASAGMAPSVHTSQDSTPQLFSVWLQSSRAELCRLQQHIASLAAESPKQRCQLAASDIPGLTELIHQAQAAEGTIRIWLGKGGDPDTEPMPLDPIALQSLYEEGLHLDAEQGRALGMVRCYV